MDKRIALLKKGDRKEQKKIYNDFSPKMFAVCRRYIFNEQDAEDVMINGFFKVFTKIEQFKYKGSFEGWMRRIMVTESLMFLRKNKKFTGVLEISQINEPAYQDNIIESLSAQEIFEYIDQLPIGYRTVFNLYCIEGFKHREIAEQLGVSINTSKSQLILARKKLRLIIEKNDKVNWKNGTK